MIRVLQFFGAMMWVNILLPLMAIILIYGTILQGWVSLYESTQTYFMAPVFWVGFVPIPGMPIICALLCLSLIARLILDMLREVPSLPNLLTHLSILLLLLGGFVTGFMAKEGYIDLVEGGPGKAAVHDYHIRSLSINGVQNDFSDLRTGDVIDGYEVMETCQNCRMDLEAGTMTPLPVSKEDEENLAALRLRDVKTGQLIYLSEKQGGVPLRYKDDALLLHRQRRELPFELTLHQFDKETHPGTDMASAYSSIVTLRDGQTQITSRISMNEPLRYKGYTIYQASYFVTEEQTVSVLSVVENMGRSFPYIAGLLMALGLTLQSLPHITKRRVKL